MFQGVVGRQLIAIKELKAKDHDAARQVAEFAHEIEVMRRLQHPNIVRYIGSERIDMGTLLIFQEWMEGGSLKKYIADFGSPGLRDTQVAHFTRQLLCGLAYLHEQRVVHRDIKPGNVLLNKDLCIKLADRPARRARRGRPRHCGHTAAAPEVVRAGLDSKMEYGQEADVWSVGCTVYQMSTGDAPWKLEVEESASALVSTGRGAKARGSWHSSQTPCVAAETAAAPGAWKVPHVCGAHVSLGSAPSATAAHLLRDPLMVHAAPARQR